MDCPVLSGRSLSRHFNVKGAPAPVEAVRGVSLEVASGALTALVGPDGAGKTTLLRMAAGLLAPSSGSLSVLGIDVAARPQEVQDRISYMPQRFGLYEDLSVQENMDLYADLHGVPAEVRRERFARLLHMTDLARFTARPAGKLSGGMKQKLGLACTLVRLPELLLLDEPTVGVDPLSRRELWEIVQQLVDEERRYRRARRCKEQVQIAILERRRGGEAVAETEQHRVVVARVCVGEPGNVRRRHRAARIVEQGCVQGALGRAGFGHRLHLRAHDIGAQEVVGDGEAAVGVGPQQAVAGRAPEIGHATP